MTEDLIAMAKQVGMEVHERKGQARIGSAILTGCDSTEQVERFAALIEARAVARTREECAKAVEDCGWPAWSSGTMLTDVHAAVIRALGERT